MSSTHQIKAAAVSGTGDRLAPVLKRAIGDLLDQLDARADLVFAFISTHFLDQLDDHFHSISEMLMTSNVFGCTAESVICQRTEFEAEPAIALWAANMPGVDLSATHLRFDPHSDGGVFLGWPDEFLGEWSADSFLIALADPFSFPLDVWLQRMNTDRSSTKIIGGMASGGTTLRDCQLLWGDQLYDHGCLLLRMQGDIRLRTLVSQGCRAIGPTFVITRSERNMIFELGGIPAMQRVQQIFSELPRRDQALMNQGLHIGRIIDERRADPSQADFLIRNVIGIDEQSEGIVLTDYVRNGQTIQFHLRDGESAHIELQRLLSEQARLGKSKLAGALSFSCNGRGTRLFDAPHHDARLIQDFLGPLPMAGFFAAGEIGPIGDESYLHGFTHSVALFERL